MSENVREAAFNKAIRVCIAWLHTRANEMNDPHAKADACYDEATRRERPWLYARAWNVRKNAKDPLTYMRELGRLL